MEEVIYIEGIKEAAPVGWNGSYADEGKSQSWWLPITVVRSHINLSAFDHSEMASDINRLASCFLALCAKALIKAYRRVLHPHFFQTKGASTNIADAPCRLALESTSNHIS